MTSREIVIRAVEMKNPPRIPILFFNKYIEKSDILTTGYREAVDFKFKGTNLSEWRFEWKRLDETMVKHILIKKVSITK